MSPNGEPVSRSSFEGLDREPAALVSPALDGSKVGPVQLAAISPTVSREPCPREPGPGRLEGRAGPARGHQPDGEPWAVPSCFEPDGGPSARLS